MSREFRAYVSLWLCVLTLASGCQPTQPFFFREDGDLSHYMDVATAIEYPDVNHEPLVEATASQAPLTLANFENYTFWDLSLEEVTRISLENSQVMRQLGGRVSDGGQNIAQTTPETISTQGTNVATTYDPALVESSSGFSFSSQFSGVGTEAALAAFDAQLNSSLLWQKNDRPQNFGLAAIPNFFAPNFQQDIGQGNIGLTKNSVTGATFGIANNYAYDQNNNGSRIQPSDWNVNLEATFNQPLLQGAGTLVNRIAGPFSFQQAQTGQLNPIDGVMIARIRHDISLNDFEVGVRNMMRDVETAYWELYYAYRDLEARKVGRESALVTWQRVKALQRAGQSGGEADQEAQSRSQLYLFHSQVETALTTLFRAENRLRYLMGLAATDGRLIRPSDELTRAPVQFDWAECHSEALVRREEIRKQKWQVKRRELEIIAAKNHLMPRLDAGGRYRWLGAGDELISSTPTGLQPFAPGSNAWESLTDGNYQEWQLGLNFTMPIGFRAALSNVRHYQMLLSRERGILDDLELEVSHQLSDSFRDIDLNYAVAQTNFNRRVAAEDEVQARQALYDVGRQTLDFLLDAQRRRAEAESAYYRSLVDYNRAIMLVHYRKGSLLEYNGVYLAEGPWPGKAYFDALRRARQRDASVQVDYGWTRPGVISRGPYAQNSGANIGVGAAQEKGLLDSQQLPSGAAPATPSEEIPLPQEPGSSVLPTPEAKKPTPEAMNLQSPAASNVMGVQSLPAVGPNTPLPNVVVPAAAVTPVVPAPAAGQPATAIPAAQGAAASANPFRSGPAAWASEEAETPVAPQASAPATRTNPFAVPSSFVPTAAYEYQANHAVDQTTAGVAGGGRR